MRLTRMPKQPSFIPLFSRKTRRRSKLNGASCTGYVAYKVLVGVVLDTVRRQPQSAIRQTTARTSTPREGVVSGGGVLLLKIQRGGGRGLGSNETARYPADIVVKVIFGHFVTLAGHIFQPLGFNNDDYSTAISNQPFSLKAARR